MKFKTAPENDNMFLQFTADERRSQDSQWGIQRLTLESWLTLLVEEVGEVARQILTDGPTSHFSCGKVNINQELIQCAALCIAIAGSEPVMEDNDENN